jgi:hypothetical protein
LVFKGKGLAAVLWGLGKRWLVWLVWPVSRDESGLVAAKREKMASGRGRLLALKVMV